MAMQLQPREMWELFSQVGIGQKPQLPFPGAVSGKLRPYKAWRPIEQATMSYGYGLSGSLFQLARAYTVFARDGDLVPVTLLKAEGSAAGIRVLAPKTAQAVRHMLQLVTLSGGTAPKAQTMGYSVGGKTGTAHKQEGKGYADKKYRGFFVGIAPVEQAAHRGGGDDRRAQRRQVFRRRRGRSGVQRDGAADPAHAGRAARHERQAADRGASGGGVVLMLELHSPQRSRRSGCAAGSPARCIATAARSGQATASSHGRARPPTGASMCMPRWRRARRPAWWSAKAWRRSTSPTTDIAAYPRLKAATGPIAAAYFDAADRTARRARRHRHQRQDLDGLVAGPGPVQPGAAGHPCGLIGTLGTGRPPHVEFIGLTTPDPVLLQRQFRRFLDEGVKACAIEASSVGIVERRLDGTRIRVAVFTNFTQDHLDYHDTMEAYWQAKAELFRWPGLRAAVINLDDEKGAGSLRGRCRAARLDLWTVSCVEPARLTARDIGYDDQGLRFVVQEDGERHALATRLIGQYNVSNLLGVIAAMRAIGVPLGASGARRAAPAAGARAHGAL